MDIGAVRALIMRRRGPVLALSVVTLGAVAAFLAVSVIGQARELAGSPASATADPSPTAIATPEPTPEATATPDPTPIPTPVPTPSSTPEVIAGLTLAATFDDGDGSTAVHDVAVWNGAFVALGESWEVDATNPEPRVWRSADGQSWSEGTIDLGAGASPQALAPLADGSLMILGSIGGSVEYWSDPARAAAWTSLDGVAWTRLDLPFDGQTVYGPIEFAAGGRGIVATVDDEIWHSPDGRTWGLAYDGPRGTVAYGAVAGDEGWIVRRSNASLGTTTLLVSGDAVTWHEVDLGYVGTVGNIAGDWLASRQSEDWERTEILRSANGLDWQVIVDMNALVDPERAFGFNSAILSGTEDVLVMSPWLQGHCVSMPSGGLGAWWSVDGGAWAPAGTGDESVVTHTVGAGDVTVMAGYSVSTGDIAFWVSAR
jgi:hypothetical protein